MKNKAKLDEFFPLGIDYYQELKWICIGFVISFLYSLGFLFRLSDNYYNLFKWFGTKKVLINGAIMEDFVIVLEKALVGFFIVALCMIALGVYHYMYHYMGSKSIYIMKRLPNRFDFFKRCFISPLIVIIISFTFAFIMLVLYYWIYMFVTPVQCLTPLQWQKIWINNLGVFL